MNRRQMVDKNNPNITITRQCELLGIHKSGFYYKPTPETAFNLVLMRLLDEQYLKTPFYGVRKMTVYLVSLGHMVNRKRVQRLLRLMGLMAIYQAPNTSKAILEHKKYPYLLKGLLITKSNQVWATDITYIPMARGFMYCMAIIDLHSRFIVGWSVSNTMDAEWCAEVLKEAIEAHGAPEMMNTDQGSQFTSDVFIGVLEANKVIISMDGKGRAIDNIFIERFWRSLKYECIYLNSFETGITLKKGLEIYFHFYNQERFHENLEYKLPIKVYQATA